MDIFKPYKGAFWCSWCGEECELVPMAHTLQHDLELTLRRWKDGDCTLDDMFARVNKELERSWLEAFGAAALTLRTGTPKFVRKPGVIDWQEADDPVTDLAAPDPDTTPDSLKSAPSRPTNKEQTP
jgi:hypothetical protein